MHIVLIRIQSRIANQPNHYEPHNNMFGKILISFMFALVSIIDEAQPLPQGSFDNVPGRIDPLEQAKAEELQVRPALKR